jgi:hypothetical protein
MQNEEVDLAQLYKSLKQTNFYKRIIRFLTFVRLNKLWFILFLVSGILMGSYSKMKLEPIYKSKMLIKSRYLDNYSTYELIKALNSFIKEKNKAELKNTGFSDEMIESIKKVVFVFPIEISERKQDPFKIIVESKENRILPLIGEAIYKYLSENPASIFEENKNKIALNTEINELKKKIIDLDSMQSLIYESFNSNTKHFKVQPIFVDPSSVLRERRETFSRIIELEKKLKDVKNYLVIQKMKPTLNSEPKSNKPIVILCLVFLILGGLIINLIKRSTN